MAKILSLDVGGRRVGVALGDDREGYVVTKPALERRDDAHLMAALQAIIRAEDIAVVLVGWPLTLRGGQSAQTKLVQEFVERLKKQVAIPVRTADERLTTKLAHAAGRRRDDDSAAAAFLLTTYLERRSRRTGR